MKKYIAPEMVISQGLLFDNVMLTGSDGNGGEVIGDGGETSDPDNPVWGDSKERKEGDDFSNGLW